jgi:hypothetical protein
MQQGRRVTPTDVTVRARWLPCSRASAAENLPACQTLTFSPADPAHVAKQGQHLADLGQHPQTGG